MKVEKEKMTSSKPNCIIYVVDCLRYDHTSLSDYDRPTTPVLSDLSQDAVVFDSFFTVATWTRPVAASLLSGVYPLVHRVRHRDSCFGYDGPILPEILKSQGYETFAISGVGQFSSFAGFDRGFSWFEDAFRNPRILEGRTRVSARSQKLLEDQSSSQIALVRSEDVLSLFTEWWRDRERRKPFFGVLWTIDVHPPYEPPTEFCRFGAAGGRRIESRDLVRDIHTAEDVQLITDLYDSEIRYTDSQIGALVDFLKREGIYENTLLIILADHGEGLGEHGFFGHGQAPYEELLHVPLVINYPGGQHEGRREANLADFTDIMPTVLSQLIPTCHLPKLDGFLQGRDLTTYLLGADHQPRLTTYSETAPLALQPSYSSIRTPRWKYILTESPKPSGRQVKDLVRLLFRSELWREVLAHPGHFLSKYSGGCPEQLYNLGADPQESANLVGTADGKASSMHQRLTEWTDECRGLSQDVPELTRDFEDDRIMREHLRALGYMD